MTDKDQNHFRQHDKSARPRAVVLLSGGLDSVTVLAIASQDFSCHALMFNYAQRGVSEINAAIEIAQAYGVSHQVIQIDDGVLAGTALIGDDIDVPDGDVVEQEGGIPVTYVPARNTLFLSHALAVAEVHSAQDIFIGVNAVDYSGYPDCRPEFIQAFEAMANLATKAAVEGHRLRIHAPLQKMSKAEIIAAGRDLGVDYSLTVSCYQANTAGEACGHCDSCRLRQKGFEELGMADPTRYY